MPALAALAVILGMEVFRGERRSPLSPQPLSSSSS